MTKRLWWAGRWGATLFLPVQCRREVLKKHCSCGRLVWDVQMWQQLSSFAGRIICQGCGKDHSRVPTLWWLARFYMKRLAKRRRVYGLWGMWRASYPVYFWRFRGKEGPIAKRERIAAQLNSVVAGQVGGARVTPS